MLENQSQQKAVQSTNSFGVRHLPYSQLWFAFPSARTISPPLELSLPGEFAHHLLLCVLMCCATYCVGYCIVYNVVSWTLSYNSSCWVVHIAALGISDTHWAAGEKTMCGGAMGEENRFRIERSSLQTEWFRIHLKSQDCFAKEERDALNVI